MRGEAMYLQKRKLNVRFHNPNSTENTLKYIGQIFVHAGKARFESVLRESLLQNRKVCDKIE